MNITAALLDSWDRQSRIVNAVATRVTPANKLAQPSPDGMPLFAQLAHIHKVRAHWLGELDKELSASLPEVYLDGWSNPVDDLEVLRDALVKSGEAVRAALERAFESGQEKCGGYDNPVLFLQHMVWHDGWHVGLILLALRQAGEEPTEEWEELNVWGEWRTEVW